MPTSLSNNPKMVLTMGDPSGIGPEITLKSLGSPSVRRLANFFIIGDYFVLKKTRDLLGIKIPLKIVDDIEKAEPQTANIYDLKNVSQKRFKFGKLSSENGRASIEYLNEALSFIGRNKGVALVTAPINKEAINNAGFHYGGHTEFLAKSTKSSNIAMMLIGGPLRVALVTRHIPLKDIPKSITEKKLIDAIGLTRGFIAKFLDKKYPKIAVAGLNPHGGEGGVMGDEEEKIIKPAVVKAKRLYRNICGPFPADSVFYDAYRGKIDGVVCMYHDQGLIPLKMIARDTGVNITLGLPFIRTSPDHGTAFDIAGKGVANPSSMIEAIKVAAKLLNVKC
ncbi:MAG: 4-hydroxythreonine-4-phosphate dehydrogenase PdxA [Candidatus Omnitrophica bacterium CG07_land_8_20_14_0_80_42_15]|uniref:4-hydroxythreonine-4-phosphate dehydrogenase n=1 Tax=Candidatus Aquitaenariimonas noxiae TaxID=1974741 RepID=A0A2J0KSP1_9BACT|nr:MAG: 4-hydroxythreonine-4-phosphate dehydrogenase PdxA [Candidatus Omnitrophica bacterium CG07_land_8_20_14_0_80_42_15]